MKTETKRQDYYPSRVFDHPRILERRDPVVYGSTKEDGRPGAKEAEFFEKNGYLFYESLFSEAEVRVFLEELGRLSGMPDVKSAPSTILEPESRAVRSIFNIHRTNELLKRLSRDARVLDIVTGLLGSRVYIHQSRINYKPGFQGKDFYWHSDFETWHIEDGMPQMRALSCSISLTENTPYNGPVMVIPGSHKHYVSCVGRTPGDHYKDSLRKQEYGVPDHDSMRKLAEMGGIVAPTGPAGSVLLFECNIMHGSNSNITPWPRSNIFYVYNSVENTLQEPFHDRPPRPDFIASRDFTPVEPLNPDDAAY
jgi:ectoine hydroxylase